MTYAPESFCRAAGADGCRRTLRSNALEKLAKLSAQSPASKSASPELQRIYRRCPNGLLRNGMNGENGVTVTTVSMVRTSYPDRNLKPPPSALLVCYYDPANRSIETCRA